jgi:hypothetical protein
LCDKTIDFESERLVKPTYQYPPRQAEICSLVFCLAVRVLNGVSQSSMSMGGEF